MRSMTGVAGSRSGQAVPSVLCRHTKPVAQLTSFTGFRRANEVDAASQPQSRSGSLSAAVQRSSQQGRRKSGTRVTRMMFERFTEKVRRWSLASDLY